MAALPSKDSRPGLGILEETRHLARLALPLMGAQLAQMGMGVLDAVMAGRYGSTDLAGVALGGSIYWPVLMLAMGLVQAVTPMVAQLNGAARRSEIGEVIRQGLWLALAGAAVAVVILNNVRPVYAWLEVDPAAASVSVAYVRMCSLGLPALMCFFCLRFLADGMGFTRPALIIAVSALLVKIPLNYAFIYGKFGLPELGGVGCGVAQAILMWVQLGLILIVVMRRRFDVTGWKARFSWPQWPLIRRLLIIGIPIGATIFAEMGLFSFTTLLLGRFGTEVVAAHNIAMNINGVMFMPPMALGMAATIRIGFRVGAGELAQARVTAAIALGTTVVVALLASAFIFFLRGELVALYTIESSVHELATVLLLFVVFFLTFDSVQATGVGALRGYKDTRIPMYIALVSYWLIGLPTGCVLGFGLLGEPMGVYGFWLGLAAGVGSAAFALCVRLWRLSGNVQRIHALSLA